MNTLPQLGLDDLRTERHRLSEEVARLAWLRRLLVARCDLEVARLVGGVAVPGELPDDVRDALASARLTPDTLRAAFGCVRALEASVTATQLRLDEATRELVARYAADPALCLPEPRH